ncbi:hypothetical protein NG895_29290 [Aeoliella sp. ICT_H6.2]|uniref:MetA-pathway of phenol degradation n=1 Tax=Aeoliella straminimaris TaxID=2954799 RepID=A0A9X2FF50_9BACT|nr:hypothetical protein [Aeoliella straminimaris]MCO6048017.1 hypothetical protein [Aeoliella straminimaris]
MKTFHHGLTASCALLIAASAVASARGEDSLARYFEYSPNLTESMQQDEVEPVPTEILGQDSVAAEFCEKCCYACGSCNESCGNTNCCGTGGVSGCGCYDSCGCALPELVLGCFCPTPCGFDDWISPMTNPVYFEDPRTLTELRGIFIQHKVPQAAGGGDIQLYAVQIRAALTDRLSLIATKDGYAVSSNPLIRDGWADVSLGLKYNLIRDYETESLLTTGFAYEMPVGSPRTLQGNGDGEFHLFVTGGTELCCDWHYLSAFGLRLPADDEAETTSLYWSNHVDYHLGHGFYALAEFNWYHWLESGNGGIPGVSGGDLFNFGSTGVAGNDIVTGAFGVKYKPNRLTEIGLAWENPLTERRDVLENRLTADLILRY